MGLLARIVLHGTKQLKSHTPGIVVTGSQGLHGQIIFDNPFVSGDPPRWGRPIVVGSTTITRSSYYDLETSSAALGGGAIGEVPFYRYNQDCDPVYNPTNPEKILVTEFVPTGTIPGKSIKFRFYGPVRTNAAETDTDQPIRFVKVLTSEEVDQTDKVAITLKRGSDTGWSRQVEVKGKEGVDLMPGLYYIYARTTGPSRLYCDQLAYATNESVYSSWYPIELREDCNQNGVDDATDIAEDPWLDQWGLDGGLGANGRIDHCEWSGCPADFDFNGFVNGDDYDAFVYWYELGDPRADYDFNGFVNGDDFDAFVAAFNGGC